MSIKVNFRKNIVENKIINYVLFSDENFKILGLNKTSLSNEATAINKTTENYKIKDNNFLNFNINPNKKIIIVKLKNTSSSIENEKIGAQFYDYIKEKEWNLRKKISVSLVVFLVCFQLRTSINFSCYFGSSPEPFKGSQAIQGLAAK